MWKTAFPILHFVKLRKRQVPLVLITNHSTRQQKKTLYEAYSPDIVPDVCFNKKVKDRR